VALQLGDSLLEREGDGRRRQRECDGSFLQKGKIFIL
jgi:hypothetical protein